MDFNGFDWDSGNSEKCQKHGVSINEIESLFQGELRVGPDPHFGEKRFRAVGRTAEGRALFVVFAWRTSSRKKLIRPISARYMHKKEVDAYEKTIPRV